MAAPITTYTGDTGLGIGGNENIPVGNKQDFTNVNNALRDVMMLNNDKNIRLYNQKIADRDNLEKLIADNQISTGTIDPEDQKYVDEGQKRMQDAFLKWGGDFNNVAGYRAYQQAAQQYKDTVKQAQTNYLGFANLRKDRANLTLDRDINNWEENYKKQKAKPFWQQVTPYQKLFDFSEQNLQNGILGNNALVSDTGIGVPQYQPTVTAGKTTTKIVNGKPVTTTTQTTTPIKGQALPKGVTPGTSMSVNAQGELSPQSAPTTKYYSWNNILNNAQQGFMDGGELYQDQKYKFDAFNTWLNNPEVDNDTKQKTIDSMNNRLQNEYKEQTGGKFGLPPKVDIIVDPKTGQRHINMPVATFNAALQLANINGNYKVTEPGAFNKDIGEYLNTKDKNALDAWYKHAKIGIDQQRANAYAAKVRGQLKALKTDDEQNSFLQGIYNSNLTGQSKLVDIDPTNGRGYTLDINANKSAPVWTFDGTNPVQLQPYDSEPITDSKGKILGYKSVDGKQAHYKQQYVVDGTVTPIEGVFQKYLNVVRAYKPEQLKDLGLGSLDDFIKKSIQNGNLKVNLEGENGTTNEQLNGAAMRIISNKNQKKFQTAPFSDESDNSDNEE